MANRKSGILLHISSLPSPYGIGDLGPESHSFVKLLRRNKQSLWQVLPIHPTDPMYGNSPYSSHSTFAGNTHLISPQLAYQDGWLTKKSFLQIPKSRSVSVNYLDVIEIKKILLDETYRQFLRKTKLPKDYEYFIETEKKWLFPYAAYKTLNSLNNSKAWNHWNNPYRKYQKKLVQKLYDTHKESFNYYMFSQFLFFSQWHKLKKFANENGISLIGDLPYYVSFDSADVWENPHLFKLRKNFKPAFVGGVPPDYFSATGQRWGNPVYKWQEHKKNNFKWWLSRLNHQLSLFDTLRIDHFRAFAEYWEIPAQEPTAVNGKWRKIPGDKLFAVIKQKYPDLPFIAEDLGYITPAVEKLIEKYQIPNMKVLQFAFEDKNYLKHTFFPENYKQNCVAYTGTHDNNTLKGWFQKESSLAAKKRVLNYLKAKKINYYKLIQKLYTSKAKHCILPIQDILLLDEKSRMNIPGTSEKNWTWRASKDQLKNTNFQKLKTICIQSNRS